MTSGEFAPAKVNLYLHVGRIGPDGYHPLESWMVFADVGDRVRIEPSDRLAFAVEGPFAGDVPPGDDNLAVRARDAALFERPRDPFLLMLEKELPPAAGLGGGSADAAAVLRLLGGASPERVLALGADVPACLRAKSLIARGRGEIIVKGPKAPPLPAVLVNPGIALSTAAVFARFDEAAPAALARADEADFVSVEDAVAALSPLRNDLQAPALALAPAIGTVLEALAGAPETLLSRMTGSGATCFALCATQGAAESLAARLSAAHPGWWIRATTLS